MTKMRRALAGSAFAAMLALSFAAAQGTAWAATIDTRDGTQVVDGRATTPPTITVPPTIKGGPSPLGVTWED